MPLRKRLLGLAFAASDLLLELEPDGRVVFAIGSGPSADVPAQALLNAPLADHLGKASAALLTSMLEGLSPGRRSDAMEVLFNAGPGRVRRATLHLFVLPDLAPRISAATTWEGPAYRLHDPRSRPALTPVAFLDRTREVLMGAGADADLAVSFVEVPGLARVEGEAGARLNVRVEAALQAASVDGGSAGRLGPDRFAMLRRRADDHDLAGEIDELGRSEGVDLGLKIAEAGLDSTVDPLNALRALRFAVEGCLQGGGLERPELTFTAALSRTLKDADAFRSMVKARDFELHYQPIVDLRTGAVHHFEALARFRGTSGPANTIHMAEELALIDSFDVAVAEMALSRLRRPGAGLLKFAVNVSGVSLADDRYVQSLMRMTAANPDERRRLIVEVTESAALADMEAANRRLGALRGAGFRICIDDFGTGAASYDYLRGLAVDTVKIDGRFVIGLESEPRTQTMLAHLIDLCATLGIDTIAERVETEIEADILRNLGVAYGQGWLFGKATKEPQTHLAASEGARRLGTVVGWG